MNEDVKSLGSVQLMNDRCVDMQRSKHGTHGNVGCAGCAEVSEQYARERGLCGQSESGRSVVGL